MEIFNNKNLIGLVIIFGILVLFFGLAAETLAALVPTPPCVDLLYPQDRWQRVWYTWPGEACLGWDPTKDELNEQFDNNWGGGVIAYGRDNNIQFTSSRKINFPEAGVYRFTIGSDDGVKLWIDDILRLDRGDRPYTVDIIDVALSAGSHNFQIDYYENVWEARVSFAYAGGAAFFYDDFSENTIRDVYLGDECRSEKLVEDRTTGNWDVYLQNISCVTKNWCRNKVADEGFSCADWRNLPYADVHPEHHSPYHLPDYYSANVGITNGALKMERQVVTAENQCTPEDDTITDRLAHRYMVVKSAGPLVSSETFKLDLTVRLSEPKGWGIGWYIGEGNNRIIDAWYPNSSQNTRLNFPNLGVGQPCPSAGNNWKCGVPAFDAKNDCFCNLPGQDQSFHRIEVWSQGNTKKVWVDKGTVNEWYREGTCVSNCPSSGGDIWFGNRVHQVGGCGKCSFGGTGGWPVFEIDYISLNRGPKSSEASVVDGSGCAGGTENRKTFKTTFYDDDGDFKNVQLLINKTSVINPDEEPDPEGFFWGKFEKIPGMFGPTYQFCIRNNEDTLWHCEADGGFGQPLNNSYSRLRPALSSYSFEDEGKKLIVNWDVEFKPAWKQEDAKLWLYVIDESDLTDEFEEKGNFGIDNVSPDVPTNFYPVNNGCTDPNPNLILNLSNDTGCGRWSIQYQFRLDYNENHNNWNQERDWGNKIWETNFDLTKGDYWWQAQSKDSVGNVSAWSDWWTFKIPCNEPPVAQMECAPSVCIVYETEVLTLKNTSYDCDSSNCIGICGRDETNLCNDDIKHSWWSGGGSNTDCSGICNYTIQGGPGTYTVQLKVIDFEKEEDVASREVWVENDVKADFRCYVDQSNPTCGSCDSLKDLLIGQKIYLIDDCGQCPWECSEASGGIVLPQQTIEHRRWWVEQPPFPDNVFSDQNEQNPSVKLRSETNTIYLEVTDSAGRKSTKNISIGATLPLPEWIEVPPR